MKIGVIFSWFDQSYKFYKYFYWYAKKKFLDGIEQNIGKVVAYKEFVSLKIKEFQKRLAEKRLMKMKKENRWCLFKMWNFFKLI